jgi:multidrug efflux pump subunit AcrB
MHVVTDRTQTIRASVNDVQFTLVLTIILVVMVIFLFLRDLRATVIPSITVPLSLIGTFAVMYLLGYSLNTLSLMALTIATGFVVDDAIVMVENVTRYLEQGDTPLQAALKGSKEIGFTIVSISISLIAVFIPVLLMGGLIGRLFREFAVTVSIAILMSTIVSLTLTPMMCAQLLREPGEQRRGRLYLLGESVFANMLATYETGLQRALRHRRITLAATLGTVALTGYLYVVIPKGFFPQQDTGFIVAVSEAAQDISFSAMIERQSRLIGILLEEPGIDGVISAVGAGGVNQTVNNGRMFINLKPRDERDASASEIIDRLRPKLAQVEGIASFMQASQDINVAGSAGPNINSPFRMATSTRSTTGLRSCSGRCRVSRCCAMSRPTNRSPGRPCGFKSTATRHHGWASRPRPSTTRCTTPSAHARSRSSSPSRTAIGSCSRSTRASNSIPTRSI